MEKHEFNPVTEAYELQEMQRLSDVIVSLFDRGVESMEETHELILAFAKSLQKKYPNARDFKLYHVLIGSSPEATQPFFDFPEEDSVKKFVELLPLLVKPKQAA